MTNHVKHQLLKNFISLRKEEIKMRLIVKTTRVIFNVIGCQNLICLFSITSHVSAVINNLEPARKG